MLTTFIVDSIGDGGDANLGDGVADDGNGNVTLRAAIEEANALSGDHIIEFSASSAGGAVNFHDATPDVITLGGTQLEISSDITITGPGADLLTVSGNDASRVIRIATGDYDVVIDSLTVADGRADGQDGIGIRNQSTGSVIIRDAAIVRNTALTQDGPGIRHGSGSLRIERTLIAENSTNEGWGAVFIQGGVVDIIDSTIQDNTTTGSVGTAGAGIGVVGGTLNLVGSTVTGNNATQVSGGGMAVSSGATVVVINSTFSGNSANNFGGGIQSSGDLTIINSSVVGNTAGNRGGGINQAINAGTLINTLVVGNTAGSDDELSAVGSANLIRNNSLTAIPSGLTLSEILNPTLADNGGLTLTHALVAGSQAINAGDNTLATDDGTATGTALTTDQRGTGFDRIVAGTVDIGAVEFAEYDFGDAPDSYGTTLAGDGPRHFLDGAAGLFLGAAVDADEVAHATLDGTGDDSEGAGVVLGTLVGNDDEDGVTFDSAIAAGQQADITVTSSAAGLLDAWLDFDASGTFDVGEQIFTSEPMLAGANALSFSVPANATLGNTFIRFRLSTAGGLAPTGPAQDGEVEDYAVDVVEAQSLVVTTVSDTINPFDSETSLREAIAFANETPNTLDEITFSDGTGGTHNFHDATPDVITLGGTQLEISSDITITGPGADLLTVSGDDSSRVFDIADGNHDVTFDSLTIADGEYGIYSDSTGTVEVRDSVVTNNIRSGILAEEMLVISGSTISFNGITGTSSTRGGIRARNGLLLVDSLVTQNDAKSGVSGAAGAAGGISASGIVNIVNSTVSRNRATIAGNLGIGGTGTVVNIINSTIANSRNNGGLLGSAGSEIETSGSGTVNIFNSIVAGNDQNFPDILAFGSFTFVSNGHNLIGTAENVGTAFDGDLRVGADESTADYFEAEPSDNGGKSFTHALVAGSAAINAGANANATDDGTSGGNLLTTDQRGSGFDRIVGPAVDIGAFEVQPTDTTNPELLRFERNTPTDELTNADTLAFLATFSEPVQNVTADDFGKTGTTASIAVNQLTASTYEVTLNGGNLANRNNVVQIDLSCSQNIQDLAGNDLPGGEPATDESYTLDNTAPELLSFERNTPSNEATNADTLTFLATFSEDVQNVNAADFTRTGTNANLSVNQLTPSTYEIMLSGGNLANRNNVVQIDLSGSQNIQDLAGNDLPDGEPATDESYTLDNTAPELLSFERNTPSNEATNADTLTFLATFSEAVQNVNVADFNRTGTNANLSVNQVSASTYEITLSGGNLANRNNNVQIDLRDSHNITDLTGNDLPDGEPSTDESYTVDNTAPTLTAFARNNPASQNTNADTLVFDITFDEDVANVDAMDFVVDGLSGVTKVLAGSGAAYTLTISDGDLPDANTTVQLNLAAAQDITDIAGNDLANAEPATDETYIVQNDVTAPTPVITATQSGPTNADPINVSVDFGEEVSGFEVGDLSVGNGSPSSFDTSDNQIFTFDVSPTADGDVTVDIAADVAADLAGNNNLAATQFSIAADQTAPTATISRDDANPTNATSVVFSLDFDEDVSGVDAADFQVSTTGSASANANVVVSNAGDSDDSTYTVTVNNVSGDGTIGLNIASGTDIVDAAGNTADTTPATDEIYTIDNTAPTLAITRDGGEFATGSVTFNLNFSEDVIGVDVSEFNTVTSGSVGILNISSFNLGDRGDADDSTYSLTLSLTGNYQGTLGLELSSPTVMDVAANDLNPTLTASEAFTISNTPLQISNTNDDGFGSLRFAVKFANDIPGADVVEFAPQAGAGTTDFTDNIADTITLTSSQIRIEDDLTIIGVGPHLLTLDGNNNSRIFDIRSGNHDVTLQRLRFTNGTTTQDGGALVNRSSGQVELDTVVFSNNTASNGGGAVSSAGGSTGSLTIRNSTLSGNNANGGAGGGAIINTAALTVVNSTLSGNMTTGSIGGGGILHLAGLTTVVNSTIVQNGSSNANGGGVSRFGLGLMNIDNTIVSGNTSSGASHVDDIAGNFAGSNSLIGGNVATIIDTTLADNGGPTLTHALISGSPAINAGDNALATERGPDGIFGTADDIAITTDQRGTGFARIIGGTVDIGAFESEPPKALDFGDAADIYPVTLAEDGARHVAVGVTLGASRDDEADGIHSTDASADGADEDGVVLAGPIIPGGMAEFDVTASGSGFLNAWIDLNRDGDFTGQGEHFLSNEAVSAGAKSFSLPIASDFIPGDVTARFRITSASVATPLPTGLLPDGEVEDYVFMINDDARIIDNGDLGYSESNYSSSKGYGFGADVGYAFPSAVETSALWTFDNLQEGNYQVSATWAAHQNRASDAPFTISHDGNPVSTFDIDQKVPPSDFEDGGTYWKILGYVDVTNGEVTVELTNDANGIVLADAVRVERVGVEPEIDIFGGVHAIADGDTTPRALDHTDFQQSSRSSRTFTIENNRSAELSITDISISGTDADDFSVGNVPSSVAAGESATFDVVFEGSGSGVRMATVTVESNDSDEGVYNFDIQASPVAARIIDNRDGGFAQTGFSFNTGYGFQSNVNFAASGNGSSAASWTFDDLTPGTYQVSTTWAAHNNRATDAPFTVSEGSTQLLSRDINQQAAPVGFVDLGTAWEVLGTFTVTGSSLVVELTNDADGFVLADAVRLDAVAMQPEIDVSGNSNIILSGDNTPNAADFTDFGTSASSTRTFNIQNTGNGLLKIDSIMSIGGNAEDFQVLNAPTFVAPGTSSEFQVAFTASANGVRVTTIQIDSDDTDEATYTFDVQATGTDSVIIDDGAPGYSSTAFAGGSGYGFDDDVQFSGPGTGSSVARWTFGHLTPGIYSVFATWAAHQNRATDAPYTVLDGAVELGTFDLSQQIAPNDRTEAGTVWEDLGTFTVTGSSLVVELSNDANGYVIADAIAIRPEPATLELLDSVFEDPISVEF